MTVPPAQRYGQGVHQRTFRAFRDPNYRVLWPASVLGYLARWMQMTVLGWMVLQLTSSAWRVALVGFFASAPLLVLGLVGGYLADTTDRKWVMVGTQTAVLVSAASMSALLVSGAEEFWHAYPVAMVIGVSWALDMPSRRSSMHDLLGSSGVTNGVALDAMGMSASRMAGPALAGVLIAVAGLMGAYLFITVVVAMSTTLLLRFDLDVRGRGAGTGGGLLSGLTAGLKYVAGNRVLMAVVVVTVLMNLLMFPYMHLVPVIARDVLNVGPVLMGILMAGEGTGALVGSVAVAATATIHHHGRLFIGGSTLALLMLLMFSLSDWYFASLPLLLVLGVGAAGFATMQGAMVMLVARADMRGKALGVVSLAIGASPFGALLEGAVAGREGPEFALGLNAVLGLILIALTALLMPTLIDRTRGAADVL